MAIPTKRSTSMEGLNMLSVCTDGFEISVVNQYAFMLPSAGHKIRVMPTKVVAQIVFQTSLPTCINTRVNFAKSIVPSTLQDVVLIHSQVTFVGLVVFTPESFHTSWTAAFVALWHRVIDHCCHFNGHEDILRFKWVVHGTKGLY